MPGSQGCLLLQPGLSWHLPAIRLRCGSMSRLYAIRAGCTAPAASQKAPPQQERRQRDSSAGAQPGWAPFAKREGLEEAAPDRWSDKRAAAGRVQTLGSSAPGLSRWSTDNAVRQAAAGRTTLAPRRADAEAASTRDKAGVTAEPDLWYARRGSPYSSVAPGGMTEQGASHPGRPALQGWLQQVPLDGLHKPVGLVLASAYVLAAACHLSGAAERPAWLPTLLGAGVGLLFTCLNRAGMRRFWRAPRTQLSVVVTGSGKGIGKAIAREFLRAGDKVVVTSRSLRGLRQGIAELRSEVGPDIQIFGQQCDVTSPAGVAYLTAYAESVLGTVDVWINNAGYSGSFQSFMDARPEQLQRVVQTNLLGTLLCTRAAMQLMGRQPQGGHIFLMDGAGADGMPTPQYAAYGATKAGVAHLGKSLKAEAGALTSPVGIHTLSPGMVLTDLLLDGATYANKQIFNILCEQPETVAAFLVPRVRTVVARHKRSSYIKYLTPARALAKFAMAPTRGSRYFDKQGNATYFPERERIMGERSKQTERLAKQAARRNRALGLAYALSMAASYLFILADASSTVS